jgi:hypothetical protein
MGAEVVIRTEGLDELDVDRVRGGERARVPYDRELAVSSSINDASCFLIETGVRTWRV